MKKREKEKKVQDERPKAYKIATIRFGLCDVCRKEGRVWQYYIASPRWDRRAVQSDIGDGGLNFCSILCAENYHGCYLEEMPAAETKNLLNKDQIWRALEQIFRDNPNTFGESVHGFTSRDARVVGKIILMEQETQ
jgi:hypothetical protein